MCPNGKDSEHDEVYRVSRTELPWPRYWVRHEHNNDHPYYQTRGYRKPQPGMLELAIQDEAQEEYDLALSLGIPRCYQVEVNVKALMVGDMDSDRQAATAIGLPYLPVEKFLSKSIDELAAILQ